MWKMIFRVQNRGHSKNLVEYGFIDLGFNTFNIVFNILLLLRKYTSCIYSKEEI